MYVCVCIYIYMYIYMCVCMYIYMCVCVCCCLVSYSHERERAVMFVAILTSRNHLKRQRRMGVANIAKSGVNQWSYAKNCITRGERYQLEYHHSESS